MIMIFRLMRGLYRQPACILLVLSSCPISSEATNFSQCLADITSCAANPTGQNCSLNISNVTALSILRTSKGSLVTNASDVNSSGTVTAISFSGCVTYCGKSQEAFSWSVFSQEFSAWLLPYVALLSQLPFGARRRSDNLMSAILTLGSPTLAGYSLYMTLLSGRWLNDQLFSEVDYPSATVRTSVVRVLNSLQHVPLRIHPGRDGQFESLVVHPANDEWWTTFSGELNSSLTWSIASATSTAWVVIAYLLTVTDSLSNVQGNRLNANGQGTGSVWLWLLPIVTGWLVLSPKCDHDSVRHAYNKANRHLFVPNDTSADAVHVSPNHGLIIGPSRDGRSSDGDVILPDEWRIPPVFNYARVLSWSRTVYVISLFYRTASKKWNRREGLDGGRITGNMVLHTEVPREWRLGNRNQIVRYCSPKIREYSGTRVLWPRGVLSNMVVASLMSLLLQWGTTCAAILVVAFTPTIGIGCRSIAYLVYGSVSTLVWMLLVLSNMLEYYAHHAKNDLLVVDMESSKRRRASLVPSRFPDSGPGMAEDISCKRVSDDHPPARIQGTDTHTTLHVTEEEENEEEDLSMDYIDAEWTHDHSLCCVAAWLSGVGKTLAVVNAIGIVVSSIFQYAGVYDTCYCDSSVPFWGSSYAFSVIVPNASDISLAVSAWTGALVLALTSCMVFVGMIYLMRDSFPI